MLVVEAPALAWTVLSRARAGTPAPAFSRFTLCTEPVQTRTSMIATDSMARTRFSTDLAPGMA
jgi:hypothetical protein